ncbi:hypothetical protein [Maricaulis parjimensis]|uniref:hypothetical protein n=1 Tax=Maricaulis parjimensis TaxID=144023 RepID=UPI00193AC968|nr:hypothetical protein [Maricaulis parjimensis]
MGTKLVESPDPRIWIQELEGQISRLGHSTLHLRIGDLRAAGRLDAIIVDARAISDNPPFSLLREIWNDGLEVLSGLPVAYLPPPGHNEALENLLMEYVREWDVKYQRFDDRDKAYAWCLAQLDSA